MCRERNLYPCNSTACATHAGQRESDLSLRRHFPMIMSSTHIPSQYDYSIQHNGSKTSTERADLINFAEVMCTIRSPDDVKDRFQASSIPIATYSLSLSNNGPNFSSEVPVIVYDSKCMECSRRNGSFATHCKLKVRGFLHAWCIKNQHHV